MRYSLPLINSGFPLARFDKVGFNGIGNIDCASGHQGNDRVEVAKAKTLPEAKPWGLLADSTKWTHQGYSIYDTLSAAFPFQNELMAMSCTSSHEAVLH